MTIEQLQSKLDKLQNEFNEFVKNSKKEKVWEFTEREKEFLKTLDKKWKYLARDENGDLCLYETLPLKDGGVYCDGYIYGCIDYIAKVNNLDFKCIKWENEIPCEFRKYLGDSDD